MQSFLSHWNFLLGESSNECIYKPEFKIHFGRNPSIDHLSGWSMGCWPSKFLKLPKVEKMSTPKSGPPTPPNKTHPTFQSISQDTMVIEVKFKKMCFFNCMSASLSTCHHQYVYKHVICPYWTWLRICLVDSYGPCSVKPLPSCGLTLVSDTVPRKAVVTLTQSWGGPKMP